MIDADTSALRVAIVTGSGQGIGAAIAAELYSCGYKLALIDKSELVIATANSLSPDQNMVLPIMIELTDEGAIEAVIDNVVAHFGQIDALVNNAAVSLGGDTLNTTAETWMRTLEVNLSVPFRLSQAVARWQVASSSGGRIVNISSVNALAAEKGAFSYVTSKGGMGAMTRAMAVDLAQYQITVNSVAPGAILTEGSQAVFDEGVRRVAMEKNTPAGRTGTPYEVAAAVAYLCSDRAAFITGSTLVIDGGAIAYIRND